MSAFATQGSHNQTVFHVLLLHPFNGLFSRTNLVSRNQKGKPFWILPEQEMIGWQWHQLDQLQIICISLQTDNHASTMYCVHNVVYVIMTCLHDHLSIHILYCIEMTEPQHWQCWMLAHTLQFTTIQYKK